MKTEAPRDTVVGVEPDRGEGIAAVVEGEVLPDQLRLWFQRPARSDSDRMAAFERSRDAGTVQVDSEAGPGVTLAVEP